MDRPLACAAASGARLADRVPTVGLGKPRGANSLRAADVGAPVERCAGA